MPARNVLYLVAGLTAGAFFLFALLRGHAPHSTSDWLSPIGPSVAVAGVLLFFFDRWGWRFWLINKLHNRPILHGTWHGRLVSDWVDPETDERIAPIEDVFLVIRQRFWQVSVRQLTRESASESWLADFVTHQDGVHKLVYVYSNTPRAEVRHRSEVHYGGAVLVAPRDRSAGLEGHYFTDRATRGEMHFPQHVGKPIETHAQGRGLVAAAEGE